MPARFVDIHSHVVPSGDDGVQSVSEGLTLGRDAFAHGTRVLYATPHVGPHVPPFDEGRERRIRQAFRGLREQLPLELRLGGGVGEMVGKRPLLHRAGGIGLRTNRLESCQPPDRGSEVWRL